MSESIAVNQLMSYIERIERLEDEKKTISDDIKEVYLELKGTGFDVKAVKAIVKLRRKSKSEIEEEEATIQAYRDAIGL